LHAPEAFNGRRRRQWLGRQLEALMEELMYAGAVTERTIVQALLEARAVHGAGHVVLEDIQRQPLGYRQLLTRAFILRELMGRDSAGQAHVGLLLPTGIVLVSAFFALHLGGRAPVILNFTLGARGLLAACRTARVETLYTSRAFVEAVHLEAAADQLGATLKLIYLEDLETGLGFREKLWGWLQSLAPGWAYRRSAGPVHSGDAAVVLFTSGTENMPKGVVLSHENLLANRAQANAVLDLRPGEVFFNALPLFHALGLTMATLLPLLNGMRLFLYPAPSHYHIIPELVYDLGASVMVSTNTFLAGYARTADPYDFYNMRLLIAGAEPVREETRRVWADKFGIRILEGYGATEASPVLAFNTLKHFRAGTVGRLLPGIDHYLEPMDAGAESGRLCVRGANIMAGYLLHDRRGQLLPPATDRGAGWYDTGDIAVIDAEDFVTLRGRAKRFAKISGEMVPLATVELLAGNTWPDREHLAINLPDPVKGERIVLLTTHQGETSRALVRMAREMDIGKLYIPSIVIPVAALPLSDAGTVDYAGARQLAEADAVSDLTR
jgi:acyl-[acyl-carrier-protein]-phospholipid O-acyltransferase/long-chain-fatty-acid--[acyl-carrier-protein] ligase